MHHEVHTFQPKAKTASERSPTAAFYLEQGRHARQCGDLQRALELFRKVTLECPDCLEGYQELGLTLVDLQRYSEAIPIYEHVALHASSQPTLYKQLGFAHYHAGEYDAAAASFRTALSLSPDDVAAMQSLAEVYRMQGRFRDSLDVVVKALRVKPDHVALWNNCLELGRMLKREDLIGTATTQLHRLGGTSSEQRSRHVLDSINIEITTYCNFSCAGCYRTVLTHQGKWKNRHMSVDEFRRIVEELPPTREVLVYGVGEPSLHPRLPDLIAIAAAEIKFNRVGLTSDVSARHVDYYLNLFDVGLSSLTISVDSLDQKLADELRAGTKVQELTERIKILAENRPGQIEIRTVVSKKNMLAIPALLASLNELGPLIVHLQPYDDLGNPEGCVPWEERAWFVNEMPMVAKRFPRLRVQLGEFFPSAAMCQKPWKAPYITVDGHLTPCCRITNSETFSFGSLFNATFLDVFESAKARAWREAFLKASPSLCQGCPMHLLRTPPHPAISLIHLSSSRSHEINGGNQSS